MGGGSGPLFEMDQAKGRAAYKVFAALVAMGVCLIWWYRATNIPGGSEEGRWACAGTPSTAAPSRTGPQDRYGNELPGIDIFVCTADPNAEPPALVMSTVLSVMAYDYSPEKLNVYLSDDAGSTLTFYALWEASHFAKHWLPFYKRFKVEPHSLAAYFSIAYSSSGICDLSKWTAMKILYEEMVDRINSVVMQGSIPNELIHGKGFSEWNSGMTSRDHPPIVQAKGRAAYKVFAASVAVGVCLIWWYRATNIPGGSEERRWAWVGMLAAELWFGFYWVLTQSVRWNPTYRRTFKDRLFHRYGNELPGIDIFVCTADPSAEPPALVISTVLSVMAYDYSPEKLNVYLSDDAGSILTFYALWEASCFAKRWLPFCKRFKVEPRSPAAYFSMPYSSSGVSDLSEWSSMKILYEEMVDRINSVVMQGEIPEELIHQKGFSEWHSGMTSQDHPPIVQIIIDANDKSSLDEDGNVLPTLVYMAREKRPQHHHNFKAGAMNALIRVSSAISNSKIILNVDCDMYSNNSQSIRDALCFFLDEDQGDNIGYVQYPQNFHNITKNDLYSSSFNTVQQVELHGMDSWGGPLYIGTGCFHKRESLCGKKYSKDFKDWKRGVQRRNEGSAKTLEERTKDLATCTYEHGTLWGKEIGLIYGCAVEDVITGLTIQCRGWRSIYFNPATKGFLGVAPTTLEQTLVQHKRWSEGHFGIFLSKYCAFLYGHGKIKLGHQMGYCIYGLWAPNSFPTLYYLTIPSLCLLKGISLFPKVSSLWFIPFAYVFIAKNTYSLVESMKSGDTFKAWWNLQRTWTLKRATSYLYGTIDAILKVQGFSKLAFAITAKVTDEDVLKRYEQEVMEFGSSSPMFTIISTVALLQLLCLVGALKRLIVDEGMRVLESLLLQVLLCGMVVAINVPIYEGLFFRKDKGSMPSSVLMASIGLALLACLLPVV